MSECSQGGLCGPRFTSFLGGFCPTQRCSTQYGNMRYFLVGFPNLSGSSGFHGVLKGICFWIGNLFHSKTGHEDSCHISLRWEGYIHCSSNKGVTSMPCYTILAFFDQCRKQKGHLRGFLRQLLALSIQFAQKWLWLSKAVAFIKKKIKISPLNKDYSE